MQPTQKNPLPPNLKLKARQLRQSATEKLLWELLRNKQLGGNKFRRQHPVAEKGQFVLDFFCKQAMLAVELDGGYHESQEQQELDVARTNVLAELGVSVIRFKNEEVINHPEKVLREILASIPSP